MRIYANDLYKYPTIVGISEDVLELILGKNLKFDINSFISK